MRARSARKKACRSDIVDSSSRAVLTVWYGDGIWVCILRAVVRLGVGVGERDWDCELGAEERGDRKVMGESGRLCAITPADYGTPAVAKRHARRHATTHPPPSALHNPLLQNKMPLVPFLV